MSVDEVIVLALRYHFPIGYGGAIGKGQRPGGVTGLLSVAASVETPEVGPSLVVNGVEFREWLGD